jgi:hypothetical protein
MLRVVGMASWVAFKVGCTVVLLCGLLSACASRELTASPGDPSRSASPTFLNDDPLLTCGGFGPGFPASALTNTSNRPDDVAAALKHLAMEQPVEAPYALRDTEIADAEWFVLGGSDSEVAVAVGSWDRTGAVSPDGQVVALKKATGGWSSSGWGSCMRLEPVLPQASTWVQVRASVEPDPASTKVSVEVSEIECVSGRDPRPFLQVPKVVEDDQAVTVYWTSEMTLDGANCLGNPWVKQTLQLTEPLGDRKLLDGSRWPATPITERER